MIYREDRYLHYDFSWTLKALSEIHQLIPVKLDTLMSMSESHWQPLVPIWFRHERTSQFISNDNIGGDYFLDDVKDSIYIPRLFRKYIGLHTVVSNSSKPFFFGNSLPTKWHFRAPKQIGLIRYVMRKRNCFIQFVWGFELSSKLYWLYWLYINSMLSVGLTPTSEGKWSPSCSQTIYTPEIQLSLIKLSWQL